MKIRGAQRSVQTLLATACAFASALAVGDESPASRPASLRAHVEFLASDLLEGRGSASRGFDVAAAYVSAQFRQADLEPAGDERSYLQRTPLLEATPVLPGSSAELVRNGETTSFEYGTHYLPLADFYAASSTLTAPLVFVGFGVQAPELAHDDFATVDPKGRIAIVLDGAPPSFTPSHRAYYGAWQQKYRTLVDRGAQGVIAVDTLSGAEIAPWERSVSLSWAPQMRWLNAQGEPQDAWRELKVRFRFNHPAAAQLFEGAPKSLDETLQAAESGAPESFELPGQLTLSATTGLRKTQSHNVLAALPGADPQLRRELVVLTAHLDHLGRGAPVDGDAVFNGAHDNAVGVAMLLEVARVLSSSPIKPRRTILFAAVTAHENGLLGSDFLAEQLRSDDRRAVANLNIDTPLPLAPTRDVLVDGLEHSSLGALARSAASAAGLRITAQPPHALDSFLHSDPYSFIRRGVPALMLRSGDEPRGQAGEIGALKEAFFTQRHHRPDDEADAPIDYAFAAQLADVYARLALEAANGARPRWNRGDFLGAKFGEAVVSNTGSGAPERAR